MNNLFRTEGRGGGMEVRRLL